MGVGGMGRGGGWWECVEVEVSHIHSGKPLKRLKLPTRVRMLPTGHFLNIEHPFQLGYDRPAPLSFALPLFLFLSVLAPARPPPSSPPPTHIVRLLPPALSSQVMGPVLEMRTGAESKWQAPSACPCCGGPLHSEPVTSKPSSSSASSASSSPSPAAGSGSSSSTSPAAGSGSGSAGNTIWCRNPRCSEQGDKQLKHFASVCLDGANLGPNTVEKLIQVEGGRERSILQSGPKGGCNWAYQTSSSPLGGERGRAG